MLLAMNFDGGRVKIEVRENLFCVFVVLSAPSGILSSKAIICV